MLTTLSPFKANTLYLRFLRGSLLSQPHTHSTADASTVTQSVVKA